MQLDLLPESAKKTAPPPAGPILDPAPPAEKSPGAFKTISEAASMLGVPQHVLRFWEGRFSQIKPLKLRGGRRYYRPEDMEALTAVKDLLYKEGYTIKGAKKALNTHHHADAPPEAHPELTDRELSQLAVIRQELLSLRDILKPHIQRHLSA